jgi:hypothetical protein
MKLAQIVQLYFLELRMREILLANIAIIAFQMSKLFQSFNLPFSLASLKGKESLLKNSCLDNS